MNGQSVLTQGDLSTLSFHATKVYNTIEGGAVSFHNPKFKRSLHELKNFGFEDEVRISAVMSVNAIGLKMFITPWFC